MAKHAIKLCMKVVSHEVTSSCRATYEEVQGNYSKRKYPSFPGQAQYTTNQNKSQRDGR